MASAAENNLLNDDNGVDAGKVYVFWGSSLTGTSGEIPLNNADLTFLGEEANDRLGVHLQVVGDLNGDGFLEVGIGAHANDDGGTDVGKMSIFSACY